MNLREAIKAMIADETCERTRDGLNDARAPLEAAPADLSCVGVYARLLSENMEKLHAAEEKLAKMRELVEYWAQNHNTPDILDIQDILDGEP